jgi:hypothetical protein
VEIGRTEPNWANVTWNTVRNSVRWRLFDGRARIAVTAMVSCAAVALALFAYSRTQRATTSSAEPAATFAAQAAPQANAGVAPAAGAERRTAADPALPAGEGKRLAADRQLMLTRAARVQLVSGKVDPRITTALRLLLDRHAVKVTSFVSAEPDRPLRTITIDCIDERPIDVRSEQTAAVLEFFGGLGPPLEPRSVRVGTQGKATVIVAAYSDAVG